MTINHMNKTIEMSRPEAKAAGKYNSDTYKELKAIKADFPTYEIEIITRAKAKRTTTTFTGLNYNFMEAYIKNKGDTAALTKFKIMCGKLETTEDIEGIEASKKSYAYIKKWFLEKYPILDEHKKLLDEIKADINSTNSKEETAKSEENKSPDDNADNTNDTNIEG